MALKMGVLQHFLCMCCCLLLNEKTVLAADNCSVTIDQGSLQGMSMTSLLASKICAYLGVPYAMPPVGSLRFKEPKPAGRWSGVMIASQKKKMCIGLAYPNIQMDEDCLYLDIYTPQVREESNLKYPVLVFVPGDSYLGDNSFMYGTDYFMRNEFIVVIINFRVGVLGFLSTDNSAALGNYGLKDQVQALRWIKSNIEDFGGDPDSVTIFGHGIGAAYVHYHILSPMSKGLFHRAISQSGTALNPNMRPTSDPACLVKQLGLVKNCQSNNDIELVDCLRRLNASEFVNITSVRFAPSVETAESDVEGFLTQHPLDIIRSRNFNKVPWILGNVGNEGASSAVALIQNESSLRMWNSNTEDILVSPHDLELLDDKLLFQKDWYKILDFYFGNRTHRISKRRINDLMQLYGDRLYYFGSYMTTALHYLAGHIEIFKYNFAYNGTTHITNYSNDLNSSIGADHGDDLLYVFKLPSVKEFSPGQSGIEVSSNLIEIFSNFIKTESPVSSLNKSWNFAGYMNDSNVHMRYMEMTAAADPKSIRRLNLTMQTDLFQDRMELWLSLPLEENDVYYTMLNFAHHLSPLPLLTTVVFVILTFGFY